MIKSKEIFSVGVEGDNNQDDRIMTHIGHSAFRGAA